MKVLFKILILLVFSNVLTASDTLKITSLNLRLSTADDGANSWKFRKQLVFEYFNKTQPHVFGVQEAMVDQIRFLDSLTNYEFVGVGRDNGMTKGEYSAIFYRSDLMDLRESGTYWLSQTPTKPSMGWDADCIRICTWARFKLKNDKEFYVFNTHFDHMGKQARIESARLVMAKINLLRQDIPVFLTGDFNATPESKPIQIIQDFLMDARVLAVKRDASNGLTYNGFKKPESRIDYIFTRPNHVVLSFNTNQDQPGGKFVSDHYPIEILSVL